MKLNEIGRRLVCLSAMLRHEESPREMHYEAHLSHWYGDAADIQVDAGELQALIDHYSNAKRYILISVQNRSIRTMIWPTLQEAQKAMLTELEEAGIESPSIGMVGGAFEILWNAASLTKEGEDRNWLIAEIPCK